MYTRHKKRTKSTPRQERVKKMCFGHSKLLINSFVVENSLGCSQHFQWMQIMDCWCPKTVPTQVKCKNPGNR
jgi:hypothetical protein